MAEHQICGRNANLKDWELEYTILEVFAHSSLMPGFLAKYLHKANWACLKQTEHMMCSVLQEDLTCVGRALLFFFSFSW